MFTPLLVRCVARASFITFVWVALAGCDDESGCEADKAAIESCNRVFNQPVCNTPASRCYLACYAQATCSELNEVDNSDNFPAWLEQCVAPCAERFTCDDGATIEAYYRCDAAADCADASDERGCDYHECKNGQLVREASRCDGYAQCADESDEEGCR